MILADFAPMSGRQFGAPRRRTTRGFTFLEFTVALVVLGIALAGLFPLLAITSRGLQPIKNDSACAHGTPARDWGKNSTDDASINPLQQNQRHCWYVTPYNYDDPWLRKLGASAQVTAGTVTSTSLQPTQPSVVYLDDYDGSPTGADGTGTFVAGSATTLSASGGYKGDYHYAETTTTAPLATWSITAVSDGWYSIEATWPTNSGLTLTNATYVVTAPNNTPSTLTLSPVNQASSGTGITDSDGVTWWPVLPAGNRCVKLLKNDVVTVTLSAAQTQSGVFLIADGVRIVRNDVTITSVTRSFGCTNTDVTANVSVTVNIAQ